MDTPIPAPAATGWAKQIAAEWFRALPDLSWTG